MKDISPSPQPFEQIWDDLPSHLLETPLPEGMEDRFWQTFSQELGSEEQCRQRRAARRRWWESLRQFRWYGLAAGSVAMALLLFVVATPHSTHVPTATLLLKPSTPTSKTPWIRPVSQKHTVALQVKSNLSSPPPTQTPHLYENLQMYENMEILEKIKLLEKLPTLTKGS